MTMNRITLRPIALSDAPNIVRWRNQPEVYRNLFGQFLITEEQHVEYHHKFIETGLVKQYIVEMIDGAGVVDIGTAFLKNIDTVSRKAEFGLFIGELTARGKGLAFEIVQSVLEVAFEDMHLNKVYLSVFSENAPAIRSYKKAGFKTDGVLRQDFFDGQKFVDVILMSILNSEYVPLNR